MIRAFEVCGLGVTIQSDVQVCSIFGEQIGELVSRRDGEGDGCAHSRRSQACALRYGLSGASGLRVIEDGARRPLERVSLVEVLGGDVGKTDLGAAPAEVGRRIAVLMLVLDLDMIESL